MSVTTLSIEWRHLERDESVLRCSETGRTIHQIVDDLTRELGPRDPSPYCGACADPTDADRFIIRFVEENGLARPEVPGSIVRLAALKTLEA